MYKRQLHELFGVSVLTGHDVGDAEVRQDDGGDGEKIVHLAADERLVVSDGITILVVLHEEDVSDVQLPSLVLAAELGGLTEDLLHHGVVVVVPVDLCLHHQDGNILVESQVILLKRIVDALRISSDSCILDGLGLLTEGVNMLVSELFELSEGFLFGGLVEDEVFEEFKIFL